jgi:hypothetical protein
MKLSASMCLALLSTAHFLHAEVGEFSIPSVLPLNAAQRARLRGLVATNADAAALADGARSKARSLFDIEPSPLKVIHYEGLVNTDPRRVATVKQLRQMADISCLMRYWQVSDDERAVAALERLIPAWTRTYAITGNDVNENKFYPLLVAYGALRPRFATNTRARVDAWVAELGEQHCKAVKQSKHFTNRYSKHVRLLALCGMVLDRPEWVAEAKTGVKRFVTQSLYADGSSLDFKRRDTLTYHGSALKPPLDLAMLAGAEGRALYAWESPQGGSLQKSVHFVVPYALGETQHHEWVNSQVDLDKRRAEAGLEKYRPGRLYEPANALDLMERASYFEPELMRVVRHLLESERSDYPTWQTLMNAVARDATGHDRRQENLTPDH